MEDTRLLSRADATVLIGKISLGQVDSHVVRGLGDRLRSAGLLAGRNTQLAVRQALNDLNHRIRYALREYDEPPEPSPVPHS